MKIIKTNCFAVLALAIAGALVPCPALASDNNETAVKKAAAQFYSALNAMFTGDVAPMNRVWSHAPDVTYMGPGGGFQVGWKQVCATWKTRLPKNLEAL